MLPWIWQEVPGDTVRHLFLMVSILEDNGYSVGPPSSSLSDDFIWIHDVDHHLTYMVSKQYLHTMVLKYFQHGKVLLSGLEVYPNMNWLPVDISLERLRDKVGSEMYLEESPGPSYPVSGCFTEISSSDLFTPA